MKVLVRSILFLVAAFSALPGWAQNGTISGQITDQQSLSVLGAAVTVVNEESQQRHPTTTDENGKYSITHLSAGRYQVIVEAAGFDPTTSKDISITGGQAAVFNVQLVIAAATADVTVSAGPSHIELDSAALSGTLSEQEVRGAPLNGRNFTQLITLTPGVSNQTGQDEAKVGVAGSAKFSVNGGRVEYNTFEVDGSDVLNTSINASRGQAEPLIVYPSVDAIQELQVLTSNYGAEYGKSASGSVLVTTKSGTDKFHGVLYEFLRNEKFNARNYFDQTKHAPLYRRQDFGGTVGGPVTIPGFYNTQKNKTFFFFSEEVRLEKTPVQYNQGVPTLQQRQGDFSDVCPLGVYALTSVPDCPSAPVSGNPGTPPDAVAWAAIGQQQVSPTATALLNTGVIPLPTSNTGCNSTLPSSELHCYTASVSPSTYYREELFRIDHTLSQTQQIFFRYIHDTWSTTTLTPQWGVIQNSFPTVQNKLSGPGLDLAVGLTQALSSGFLNRLAASYTVAHITLATAAAPGVDLSRSDAGLDAPCHAFQYQKLGPLNGSTGTYDTTLCPLGELLPSATSKNLIPGLEFNGTNPAYGGHGFAVDTGYAPWEDANPTYMLRDDVSKAFGRHTIQFGGQWLITRQNELSGVDGANSGDTQGLLTYSNQISPRTHNNAFADFLGNQLLSPNPNHIDEPSSTALQSYTQDSTQLRYHNRYQSADFYLQDDFKASSRFTLNIGFRASLFGTWYNAEDSAFNWRPEAYNQALGSSTYIDGSNFLAYKNSLSEVSLNGANPDPILTNGLVQCGKNGVPKSCMQSSIFHPGPRIGFAWDPFGNGNTSIRGGYGLFWEHGTSSETNTGSLIGSAPRVLSVTQTYTGIGLPYFDCIGGGAIYGQTTAPNPNCGNDGFTMLPGGAYAPSATPINVTSIPTKATYANVQQWSLSIQHGFGKNLVASVAYAGTKGTHLSSEYNINQLRPLAPINNPFGPHQPLTTANCGGTTTNGSTTTGLAFYPTSSGLQLADPSQPFFENLATACYGSLGYGLHSSGIVSPNIYRPYQGFNQIFALRNQADSQYHALQATLRQTAGPLDLGVAYTWSHSIDDASDRFNASFVNAYDLSQNKASSDFDQRHMVNINYIYSLPLMKMFESVSTWGADDGGNQMTTKPEKDQGLQSRMADVLLNGWQLSGITAYATGTPFSVVNGGGSNGIGPQDSAGVAYGLNAGSYADVVGPARGPRPPGGKNDLSFGPLLLNPGAFVAPRALTYGSSGRNYLNNPTRINFNMALLKHFKVFGEREVEFRTEAFNVFNHTQFRIYDPTHPGNPGNNVINCYAGPAANYSAAGGAGTDCLTGNSFLHPVDAHDPRIIQFGLKLAY